MDDDLSDLTVQELEIPGMVEWDVEHIEMMFNDRDAALILSLLPLDPRRHDRLVWHFSRNGCYTIRSTYRVAMESVRSQEFLNIGGDWSSLWKLRLPPKIKQFGWHLGRGAVPTRTALSLRGINVMQDCGCCAGSTETYWHLFIACLVAVECWQKMNLKNSWLGDWLRARERAPANVQGGGGRCTKWHKPDAGALKCNVDVAMFEAEGRSGAGICVRDETGDIVQYMVLSWVGRWDSMEAEGRAMLEALSWVEQQGWRRVAFETDAQTVAHALHARGEDWTEFGEMMRSCRAVLDRNPDFKVSFIGRGCNGVAHALARYSRFCDLPTA
ncbi:Putative ribonuclease H protein At1g65750, partial [Linum perenne]